MSKTVQVIVGVLVTLVGVFWILQGLSIIPIGGMSGQMLWVVIGFVVAVLGGILLFRAFRPNRSNRTK